jgi:hypothetical protein
LFHLHFSSSLIPQVVVPHCWLELPADKSALAKGKETGAIVDVTPNFFFACNQLQKLHNHTDEQFERFLGDHESYFDLKAMNMTKEEIARNKVGRPFLLLDQQFSSAETDIDCQYLLRLPLEYEDVKANARLKPDARADEMEAMQKRAKEMLLESYQLTLDDPDYYIEQEVE